MSTTPRLDPEQLTDGLPVSGLDYWLARHRWLPFVLPFAVYLLVGYFEPRQPSRPTPDLVAATTTDEAQPNAAELDQNEPARRGSSHFPLIYCAQIAATLLAMWLVRSVYYRVPWRLNPRAAAYGVVGGLLWIVVCRWGLEVRIWAALGLPGWAEAAARPAFNPLAAFQDAPVALAVFLALRFAGLVIIVPLIEEFFLRGFLMRFFLTADWWTIPLGTVTLASAGVVAVYGVLSHPAEWIAALLWFSLITLLYARTRNLWDCVVAHAITNGMLGIYIVGWQDWTLW